MIAKKKICKDCGKENYIWSKGRCKYCASKSYKKTVKPRKPTGERALFLALWKIRPHICANCLDPLGDEPLAHFFSHDKTKKAHSELRLDPNNISILCWDCHNAKDCRGKEAFDARKKVKINFPLD